VYAPLVFTMIARGRRCLTSQTLGLSGVIRALACAKACATGPETSRSTSEPANRNPSVVALAAQALSGRRANASLNAARTRPVQYAAYIG
jgi:hypothetical protein